MKPIAEAARLMGNRKIVRTGTAKKNGNTIHLWELNDGVTLELISGSKGFSSVTERHEGFDELVDYYMRCRAHVFVPRLKRVA